MALQDNDIITPEALVQKFQEVVVNNILKDVYHSGRPPVKSGYTLVPVSVMDHIDNVNKIPNVGGKNSTVNATIILNGLINLVRNLTRVGSFAVTVWYKSSRGGTQQSGASIHEVGNLTGKILFNTGYIRNSFNAPSDLSGVVYGNVIRASSLNQLFYNIYTAWSNTDREKYLNNIQMCHDSCHYNCHGNCHCSCHSSCHGWNGTCNEGEGCNWGYTFPAPSVNDNPSGTNVPYPSKPNTSVGDQNELNKWEYTISGNSIILTKYKNYSINEDVIVYDKYTKDGVQYNTKITNGYNMFSNKYMKSITFGDNVDTREMTDTRYMFSSCTRLENLNLGNNFNTSNVTSMRDMFYNCYKMSLYSLTTMDTHRVTDCSTLYNIFGSYIPRDHNNVPTRNPAILVTRSKWTITSIGSACIARINYIDE